VLVNRVTRATRLPEEHPDRGPRGRAGPAAF
jgi:hypothetical protein